MKSDSNAFSLYMITKMGFPKELNMGFKMIPNFLKSLLGFNKYAK